MSLRSATVESLDVPDLSTVVLTRTVTALASESPLADDAGNASIRRLAAVLAMFAGALARIVQ